MMRSLGAIAYVITMVTLWRRLKNLSPRAPWGIVIAAIALTPLVVVTLRVGNNTPLIIVLAAAAFERLRRPGSEYALGIGIAMATALKIFPGVLILVALARKRYRVAAAGAIGLVGLAFVVAAISPVSLYAAFWPASLRWEAHIVMQGFNGSLEAGIRLIGGGGWRVLVWITRAGMILLGLRLVRRVPRAALWSLAPLAMLVVVPQVLVYYLGFAVIGVAELVRWSGRIWLLPAVAAAASVPAIAQLANVGAAWIYSGGLMVCLALAVAALPSSRSAEPRPTQQSLAS
jgi:hypothetical protein